MSGLQAHKLPGLILCLPPISLRMVGVTDMYYPLLIIAKFLKIRTRVLPHVCSACTRPAELPSQSCSIKHSSGLLTQCPHGLLLIYFTMTEMTSRIAPLFQICVLLRIAAFTIWRSYKDVMKIILTEILEW